jgi:hypothetical protein
VFLFRAYERPNFVALQTPHAHVADVLMVVFGARFAKFNEKFGHSVNGNVRETACCS